MEGVKPVVAPCPCHFHLMDLCQPHHFSICSGGKELDTAWQKPFWHTMLKTAGSAKRNTSDVAHSHL